MSGIYKSPTETAPCEARVLDRPAGPASIRILLSFCSLPRTKVELKSLK